MDKEPIGLPKQDIVIKTPSDYIGLLGKIHDSTASSAERVKYESMNRDDRISLGVEATAPELFKGRLPKSQMANCNFPDGYSYILAVNRNGVESYEELSKFIKENNGINTNRQNKKDAFTDRFYIPGNIGKYGEDLAYYVGGMRETLSGYGSGFNFITCIPFRVVTVSDRSLLNYMATLDYNGQTVVQRLIENGMTPKDLLVTVDGKMSVNEKYVAGVVDNDGLYVPHKSFLKTKSGK